MLRLLTQRCQQFIEIAGVDDILRSDPGPPGLVDPMSHQVKTADLVRIGVDHETDTEFTTEKDGAVVKIESMRISIDLHDDPGVASGSQHSLHIEIDRFTLGQDSSLRMTNDLDIGIADRASRSRSVCSSRERSKWE